METTLKTRVKQAWNAFLNRDPTTRDEYDYGMGSYYRPDRIRLTRGNERTIVAAIVNRIALDVASISIKHCRLDDNDRYKETINSPLNRCLTLESNMDQTSRAFMQDVVVSMLNEGCVALVPIETSVNPNKYNSFDIYSMRTGKIVAWYPDRVKVNVYNDRTGNREDIMLDKSTVAIIENPLYAVMNEPNSTLQRLMRKLVLLDSVDEQTSSGKLDIIIQLPYSVRSDARKAQANERRKDIETQLRGSKYGIAYVDSTEKITQLNRPLESNLMKQIEYLINMLYSQLGMSQAILDGTADEQAMLNYNSRIIEPIMSAITDEVRRKFLSKTARTQRQTIMFFREPFKLVPVNELAKIADTFTRNEIMTKNEFRQVIGMKPADDPKADMLLNSNISQPGAGYDPNMDPNMVDPNMDPNMVDPEAGGYETVQ